MKHPVDVIAAKRSEIQSLLQQVQDIQKRVETLTGHLQTLEACLPLLTDNGGGQANTPASFGNVAAAGAAPAKEAKRWP